MGGSVLHIRAPKCPFFNRAQRGRLQLRRTQSHAACCSPQTFMQVRLLKAFSNRPPSDRGPTINHFPSKGPREVSAGWETSNSCHAANSCSLGPRTRARGPNLRFHSSDPPPTQKWPHRRHPTVHQAMRPRCPSGSDPTTGHAASPSIPQRAVRTVPGP